MRHRVQNSNSNLMMKLVKASTIDSKYIKDYKRHVLMGVKLVPYSLFLIFLIRKGIRNKQYVSFLIPYLIRNKE